MEIHKYEKFWFGLSLLLIVAFIGTITYGAVGAGVEMVSDDGGNVEPDNIAENEKFQKYQNANATKVDDGEYAVAVQALQFAFLPGTGQPIRVPENSEVTFYITSSDVTHGFNIVGTNVNTMAIPGQMGEMTVEFGEYDEPETFGIVCHEFCGAGHENMAGQIEVVPEEQWEGDQ
ncbi:cytochrome C oxidase subunit II [Halovenus sp. HT40]|uniref:cytochrome C oxidase subunit II n=1 Tax=Halovenus sp. HT40 TaxID=3126691 RepID=UPI00300F1C45